MARGFTLVEILVIVGIMLTLMGLAVPAYHLFRSQADLNNTAEEVINALRLAQNKTLASEGAIQYGVYFDQAASPNQYTLFKGESYALRDTAFDRIYELSKEIEIYEANLNGGSEVVFNRIIGGTSQSGNLSLRLISNPSETIAIYVANSGKITLSSPQSPTNGRIVDSRHVHFNLGWSIQNATNLKFYFPDIPIPQTEQVNMADYFDVGKTEFDWQGTFSVGGTDQAFRIHTHSLSASNTLLCIHRDRNQGKTDQKVTVYIVDGVDKDIAHYLADSADSVIKGAYGGTMEVQ